MDADSAIHCKNCHTLIKIPMPDPVIKKLPCACGITENARIIRYWATVAGLVVITIGSTIMTTCHTTNYAGVEQAKNEIEKTKIINDIDLKNMRDKLHECLKTGVEQTKQLEAAKAEVAQLSMQLEAEKKKSSPLNKYLDKKEAEQATKKEEPSDDP